jgi:hypothetical protein
MLEYDPGIKPCGRKTDDLPTRGEILRQAGTPLTDMRVNPKRPARGYGPDGRDRNLSAAVTNRTNGANGTRRNMEFF